MSTATHDTRIAIVGAGITGLTLAAALDRAGIECTVLEQAPAFGEVGAGIQLAPNAVRLLHRIGLADRLRSVAVPSEAIEMRRWEHGDVLARIPLGAACEAMFGVPYYLMTRADLHALLLEQVPAAAIRTGAACVGVEEDADGAAVRLADGTTVTADVVVGADGIRSAVRRQRVPDEPKYSGQTVYRGLVPAERLPSQFTEPGSVLWAGPGRHFVCYPVAGGRLVNFVATVPAERWPTESWSEPGSPQDVLDAFEGWDATIRTLVEKADTVTRWAVHVRDAAPRWSSGRVTLAGDAAHPMTPFMAQGANQGIEDALALAAALRAGGDIPAALRRYEAARGPRTARVQQASSDLAGTFHRSDGPQQRERDAGMAGGGILGAVEWLFGHDAELLEP